MTTGADRTTIARTALSLLDLTDLSDTASSQDMARLCDDAMTPHGPVAAICIWPRFVAEARQRLGNGHPVRIATVVNFPDGTNTIDAVVSEAQTAIADGADEIDLVIPYRALMAGDEMAVRDMIQAVRAAAPEPTVLKTILETGELADPGLVRSAAHLAIMAGADFIKTSTGKVKINATLEAADIMLNAIRESGRPVGFKPAGGVRSIEDAAAYLTLADTIMGKGWARPETFRFGASGLLGAILSELGDMPTSNPARTDY